MPISTTIANLDSVLTKQLQDMTGGKGLVPVAAASLFGFSPFPQQRKFCIKGLLGQHA